jgi:hypothetical protein
MNRPIPRAAPGWMLAAVGPRASACSARIPAGRALAMLLFMLVVMLLGRAPPVVADDDAPRPTLQVINGSGQAVDVFWLKSAGERVVQEEIPAGGETWIATTIGHRFVVVGKDDGAETVVASEVPVQALRVGGVPPFYTRRIDAGGGPIVGSARVSPFALREAAHIVNLMLVNRPDVREAMIRSGSRLCVMSWNEFTTDLPEFARLAGSEKEGFRGLSERDYWDARARGLGGSATDPLCSCAEENLLGYAGDPYSTECILIHEFAHNIHLRGMANIDPTFDARLRRTYDAAMQNGLWRGTYASTNHHEYFAEGVQSWFDNNRHDDHDHNHVHLRVQLMEYDPGLAALCREVFGDTVIRNSKPATRLAGHMAGYDPSSAPAFEWPRRRIQQAARARDARARSPAADAADAVGGSRQP